MSCRDYWRATWATASAYGRARPQKRPGLAGFCETVVYGLTGLRFWQEVKCGNYTLNSLTLDGEADNPIERP